MGRENSRTYEEGIEKLLRSYQEEMKVYKEMLENTRSELKEANHIIAMKDIELGEKPSTVLVRMAQGSINQHLNPFQSLQN